MGNFTEDQISKIWNKGIIQENYDKEKYRKDIVGAWIVREAYGKEGDYGWEIDHVYPESEGGDDTLINLRPMQWQNNRSKSDDYPSYQTSISSDGKKNIEKSGSFTVNDNLQEQLNELYDIK